MADGNVGPSGERVADASALLEGARLHLSVQGRFVTLLRLDGQLSCIDSICFHAGGPLGLGDIEELGGKKCILCPWHYYKIDIKTGDKYYQTVTWEDGKMIPGEWKSNGVKQRCHEVIEQDGGIYVHISTEGAVIESDGYAFDVGCGDRVLNGGKSDAARRGNSAGGDGRKPSGYLMMQARQNAALSKGASSLSSGPAPSAANAATAPSPGTASSSLIAHPSSEGLNQMKSINQGAEADEEPTLTPEA